MPTLVRMLSEAFIKAGLQSNISPASLLVPSLLASMDFHTVMEKNMSIASATQTSVQHLTALEASC